MPGIRWTQEELEAYLARQDRAAVPVANVEHDSEHDAAPADTAKEANPRFRIHVHSKRRRLADPDGISVKAAIDGLVRGGLLADDSVKEIQEITFSQEKSQTEETIIDVELVNPVRNASQDAQD